LFIAVWPGAGERLALQTWQRSIGWPKGVRLTPAQDLHLTLVFIGSVDIARLDAVAAAAEVANEPFELTIERLAFWRGGLCVAMPSALPASLVRRQCAIDAALRGLGLPIDERPWRPHLTLARRAGGAQPAAALPPLHWHGRGHVLAQREGEHYAVLRRYRSCQPRRRSLAA
jgi:2'-5' RNA ligase